MSDARIQALQRSDDPHDQRLLLKERMRSGRVAREQVILAAVAGCRDSRELLGEIGNVGGLVLGAIDTWGCLDRLPLRYWINCFGKCSKQAVIGKLPCLRCETSGCRYHQGAWCPYIVDDGFPPDSDCKPCGKCDGTGYVPDNAHPSAWIRVAIATARPAFNDLLPPARSECAQRRYGAENCSCSMCGLEKLLIAAEKWADESTAENATTWWFASSRFNQGSAGMCWDHFARLRLIPGDAEDNAITALAGFAALVGTDVLKEAIAKKLPPWILKEERDGLGELRRR